MEENVKNKKIREFLIKYLKRFEYEFNFLADVLTQNAEAVESATETLRDLKEISSMIDDTLREGFTKEEVDTTPMLASSDNVYVERVAPGVAVTENTEDVA